MSDGRGEKASNAGEVTPPLPDISDIEGATTGPLRRPTAATDSPVDPSTAPFDDGSAGDTTTTDPVSPTADPGDGSSDDPADGIDAGWAAPSIDGLKERVADERGAAGSEPAGFVGEPTQRFDVVSPDAAPPTVIHGEAPPDPPAPGRTSPDPPAPGVAADADPTATLPAGGPTVAGAAPDAATKPAESPPGDATTRPPANPTVSIDAQQVGETAAASRAVTTAAATPLTTLSADADADADANADPTVPNRLPDPTGDVVDQLTVPADEAADGPLATAPGTAPSAGPNTDGTEVNQDRRAAVPSGRRFAKSSKVVFIGVLVLLASFVGAWLLDSARTSNQVLRNTELGSVPIGGLDREELGEVIDELDAELATTPLTVTVGDVQIATNPAALGAEVDRDVVISQALDAGRGGSLLERPFRWIASFTDERVIEPTYRVDAEGANAGVDGVIDDALDDPLEPTLAVDDSGLSLSPGSDGVTVDPAEITDTLPTVLDGSEPVTLDLSPVATTPRLSNEAVEAVIDEASEATGQPVIFQVLDQTAEVEPAAIRDWIRLDATEGEATWAIDPDAAVADLQPRFPVLGTDEQQARFEVVDGVPEILPATETVICCEQASVEGIRDALLEPAPVAEDDSTDDDTSDDADEAAPLRTITLEPEIVSPDTGVAELESLGIVEEVSTFTTNHPCCGPRVTNIQRFADLMRGVIIRPGEDFSLNGHVGRRTIENGFVADQAIANGILEPQVGGGISQFATTFFNASFFAGLDFNEYQSHSLFIDRYPRGREATISFPRPDLSVNNSTDYGILVWTSYTETSITVTFYSTKHIDVAAGDLIRSSQGACTRYTTPRTRTYPDGTVVEDSVFAVYRPGEGLDCNGNSTRPDEEPDGPTAPGAGDAGETAPDEATSAAPTATTAPPGAGSDD